MKVLNENDIKDVISNKSGIVYFGAPWCKDCKFAKPILEELEKKYQNIDFYEINVDDIPNARDEYTIRHIPTILFLKNGKEICKRVVEPRSKGDIENSIKQLI